MQIKVLIENTKCSNKFESEHGISLYFKFKNKNFLFDTGSSGEFINNANKLGVDIKNIDYCIISHGHNDHGGGLIKFIQANKKALIYIHKDAFVKHYSKKGPDNFVYIGLDEDLLNDKRIKLLDNDTEIIKNIKTMTNVKNRYKLPITNGNLYKLEGENLVLDDFKHEQDLVVKLKDNEYMLIVGCAHNGIKNILEHFKDKYNCMPKYVFGGFHLSSRTNTCESDEYIEELGKYLLSTKAYFYTCHCTGIRAYGILKPIMLDRIKYISSGDVIKINN